MNRAEQHLGGLDAGRNHKAHAAFTRLVKEREAPIHGGDLRPIIEWFVAELDELNQRVDKLERGQAPVG